MPWIEKKDIVGWGMFVAGVGILVGWFFTDRVHGVEKFAIVAAITLMVLGAHFISSGPTEAALKAVTRTAKDVLPLTRKSNTSEQEQPPPGV